MINNDANDKSFLYTEKEVNKTQLNDQEMTEDTMNKEEPFNRGMQENRAEEQLGDAQEQVACDLSQNPSGKRCARRSNKIKRNSRLAVGCVLLTAIMIGVVSTAVTLSGYYGGKIAALEQSVQALQQTSGVVGDMQKVALFSSEETSLRNIVATVSPSVVGIKITVPPTQSVRGGFVWQTAGEEVSGSGFIMNYEGYIATNYHVVEICVTRSDALIEVSLSDGRTADGTYIAGDEQNDLAVIKIELDDLTPVMLGDSDDLMPGDAVIAIGNPLGSNFAGSVTAGIISGINRQIGLENMPDSLLQTDAAINPGNSGGPLLNMNGEVIGINTAKIASDQVEGLGFAIPINEAYPILESLMEYGYVKDRPTTGMSGTEISDLASRVYQMPAGLLIQEVESGSSAEEAGIQPGDIILTLDGQEIRANYDVNQILKQHQVGNTLEVTFYRAGQEFSVQLTLQEEH